MIKVSDFLDLSKNALVQWSKGRDSIADASSNFVVKKGVSDRTSEHSGMDSGETARRRVDGGDAYKGTMKQGYTQRLTQTEIAKQFDVTKQMRKFDKYGEIMKGIRKDGKNVAKRFELDMASMLSYAWSTSYTNMDGETVTIAPPDGLSLINPAHTANGSSNTFSNEISTTHSPISVSVLEALEEKFNNFIDDASGKAISVVPDTIITGRHSPTVHTVQRILQSNLLQGTANNDTNDFKSYNHVIVPFLDHNADETRNSDKYRYVFLAALKDQDENGFLAEISQGMQLETPEQVFESSVWQYLSTMLYDFGVLRANFIAGTKGDGSGV